MSILTTSKRPTGQRGRTASARPVARAIVGLAVLLAPALAAAEELPPLLRAPSATAAPAPQLAGIFEIKLRLPDGRGLARLLLQAGVDRNDAAAAARLAAGRLGDGAAGCDAKAAIARSVQGDNFRLERLVLFSPSGETVIERRGSELAITPAQAGAGKRSTLI